MRRRRNRRAIKMDYGVPDGGMTRRQLKAMEADARDLHDMLDDDDHLPPWLPPKVIRAQNDLSDARRIVRGELESRGIRTNPRHYRRNPYGDDY